MLTTHATRYCPDTIGPNELRAARTLWMKSMCTPLSVRMRQPTKKSLEEASVPGPELAYKFQKESRHDPAYDPAYKLHYESRVRGQRRAPVQQSSESITHVRASGFRRPSPRVNALVPDSPRQPPTPRLGEIFALPRFGAPAPPWPP